MLPEGMSQNRLGLRGRSTVQQIVKPLHGFRQKISKQKPSHATRRDPLQQPNRMFTSEMRYEYRPTRAFQQTIKMESSDSNSDGKFIFLSTLALDFARHRRKRQRRTRQRRWMGLIAKLGQRFGADRVDPPFHRL